MNIKIANNKLFNIDAITAMKRLDDFFASEDIKPAVRYPSPTETDESITVVSI